MDPTPAELDVSGVDRRPPPFHFTLRTVFVVTFLLAAIIGLFAAFNRSLHLSAMPKPLVQHDQWPRALQELLPEESSLPENVSLLGFPEFIDHKSLWCIEGSSPVVDALLKNHTLKPASASHRHAEELLSLIPSSWPKLNLKSCSWSATPGYGRVHMEGRDLFLVVQDVDTGVTIVLHEWIF